MRAPIQSLLALTKTILSHAAAVHGVVLSTEPIALARIALARLGLVRKGNERDRRPTQEELDRLIAAFYANSIQQIPVGRIIRFAVATAMRQDEICRIEWSDFDSVARMLLINPTSPTGGVGRRQAAEIPGKELQRSALVWDSLSRTVFLPLLHSCWVLGVGRQVGSIVIDPTL